MPRTPVLIGSIGGAILGLLFVASQVSATGAYQVVLGGTGSTTLTGILIGNGTAPVNTLTIGSGLILTGTTLTSSGGAGGFSTTSADFWTTQRNFFSTTSANWWGSTKGYLSYSGNPTTTVSCSGSISCSSFIVFGSSPSTISFTGSSASSTLLSDFNTWSGVNKYNKPINFNPLATDTIALFQGAQFMSASSTKFSPLSGGNLAMGINALALIKGGYRNSAFGNWSLFSNTSGFDNTSIGEEALFANVSGTFNTALGSQSLEGNSMGNGNTAIGYLTIPNVNGSENTGVGDSALDNLTLGDGNTALGSQALLHEAGSQYNTAVGFLAGATLNLDDFSSGFNTFLGANADSSIGAKQTLHNATAVGANVTLTTSSTTILGNGTNVGIATSSPGSALSIQGNEFIAGNVISTSTKASIFPYASSTALSAGTLCLDTCKSIWPLGVGTSTNPFMATYFISTSSTANNYFAGNIGVATSNPWSLLTLGSGAITVAEASSTPTPITNIDLSQSQTTKLELNGNTTINLNHTTIPGTQRKVILCEDDVGSHNVTWAASTTLLWAGHLTPGMTSSPGTCDVYSFIVTGATGTPVLFGAATQLF